MALDFPANPVNGQTYGSYTYNSTVGAWQSKEDPATVAVTSSSAPIIANNGDIWYNTNTGVSYLYYNDGTSSQWVEIISSAVPSLNTKANLSGATFTGNISAPVIVSTQSTGTAPLTVSSTTLVSNLNADLLDGQHASVYSPAGMVSQFAGATAPTGWLLCDGSAVSRTTYAALFSAINTTYGVGDGTTTFNLPDLRGRVAVGKNAGTFVTIGATGGAETHTLSTNEMPSHTHIQNSHTHTQDSHGHGVSDPGHSHTTPRQLLSWPQNESSVERINGDWGNYGWPRVYAVNNVNSSYTGISIQWSTATNQSTTATNQNTGGGLAHNNLQPYIVMNYIIKV